MNVSKSNINGGMQNDVVQSKAQNQASSGSILQAYKNGTAQLAVEEEPIQGKFETVQLHSDKGIIQKVDEKEAPKLETAYNASEKGTNQVSYINKLKELEYPFEDDLSDEADDPAVQLKSKVIQLARAANSISGPKDYGPYKNLLYKTDGVGNINFSSPYQHMIGNPYPGLDPVVNGSLVDVGVAVGNYGKENRYQHFKDANQQNPNGLGGQNGSSPDGLTWHHLTAKHKMHLVDRTVHSKHGHNGGVHLW
jgi:hypothetical protein